VPYHLAQLNIGRLVAPLGDPEIAEFEAALDAMNLLAESSPGFVWRLVADDGRSSSFVPIGDDPREAVNLSVWESIEALKHYTYRSGHRVYLQRRREWFESHDGPHLVCWWIPVGTLPTVEEAMERLGRLADEGPSSEAFTLARPFDPPAD
jgi:heme-degrading monooxygenase HmoA